MKRKGWVPASVHPGDAMKKLGEIMNDVTEVITLECYNACHNQMTVTVFKQFRNVFKCAKCGAWWQVIWKGAGLFSVKRITEDEARQDRNLL